MFHSKHTKQDHHLLALFSPWIFCRFLKFPKNVESPFTIYETACMKDVLNCTPDLD